MRRFITAEVSWSWNRSTQRVVQPEPSRKGPVISLEPAAQHLLDVERQSWYHQYVELADRQDVWTHTFVSNSVFLRPSLSLYRFICDGTNVSIFVLLILKLTTFTLFARTLLQAAHGVMRLRCSSFGAICPAAHTGLNGWTGLFYRDHIARHAKATISEQKSCENTGYHAWVWIAVVKFVHTIYGQKYVDSPAFFFLVL